MNTIAEPTQLVRPNKMDQVAAMMLLVFKLNPNTRMSRRDIESVLTLGEFSESTRQRALNVLCIEKHIRMEGEGQSLVYWMPKSGEGQS